MEVGHETTTAPWLWTDARPPPAGPADNGAGVTTLYSVPGAANTAVSISPLVVNIPTPASLGGGTPTGTVFNVSLASTTFQIAGPGKAGQTVAKALFLFATEDGTIVGWNPGIDPSGHFAGPGGVSAVGVIAVDSSGNNFTNPNPNQQTGAVYKGLAIVAGSTPIIAADPNSTAVLYASNFRAGAIEVYDATFECHQARRPRRPPPRLRGRLQP